MVAMVWASATACELEDHAWLWVIQGVGGQAAATTWWGWMALNGTGQWRAGVGRELFNNLLLFRLDRFWTGCLNPLISVLRDVDKKNTTCSSISRVSDSIAHNFCLWPMGPFLYKQPPLVVVIWGECQWVVFVILCLACYAYGPTCGHRAKYTVRVCKAHHGRQTDSWNMNFPT